MAEEAKAGKMVRTKEGQFIKGVSGNPDGRPKGSKNKITMLKLATEEAWRDRNQDRLDTVLDMILDAALEGDKAARKMIFDAVISKAQHAEDKTGGNKQAITVHRMVVNKGDDTTVATEGETNEK
jgi:hypothetical protein